MSAPLLAALLCLPAFAADRIQTVSLPEVPLSPGVSALPAVGQLKLDLATVGAPAAALQAPLSPAAFASLSAVAAGLPAANPLPAAAPPQAAATAAPAESDAVSRLSIAHQILGKIPADFSKLGADAQKASLDELWDHWKARGLVDDPAGKAFDALIDRGVDDRTLTAANKSVFLGVGVLGYPTEDALWLARTRIRDAVEENELHYPPGQRWRTKDGTPEFLGITKEAQSLVDAWGRAVEYGRQVLAQALKGDSRLPKSDEFSPTAAAGLASIAKELHGKGDAPALLYLRDEDPTFMAFLLDARKPGYYLYNGDSSAVSRVMATDAAKALGIRRMEHPEAGVTVGSTYFYRPGRVAQRLAEVKMEPYATEARELARRLPAREASPKSYTFVEPEILTASALTSPANLLSSYPKPKDAFSTYDLPVSAKTVRDLRQEGRRYGALTEERWRALVALYDAVPALKDAPPETMLRVVSQPYQTGGKVFSPAKSPERGVLIQLLALDRLAAPGESGDGKKAFLKFAAAAVEAALAAP